MKRARGKRGLRSRRGWHLLAVTAAVVGGAVLLLQLWYFAHVLWWNRFDPGPTRFMQIEAQRLRAADPAFVLWHRWVDYDRISVYLKRAVIASEDARFVHHGGVDWSALRHAWQRNRDEGKIVLGGSTITMQLARNLLLSGRRSYLRKAQEFVIAWMIEAVMDKRRILELYLNVAEWGTGVFGAEAAALHHYGIPAARLDRMQAARLAAMLPQPRYHDANPGSGYLIRRTAIVARSMDAIDLP